MNRHDTDARADVAAQLLTALYASPERPGHRDAVLDRLAQRAPDAAHLAARALDAAYDAGTSPTQRAAVLDALAAARPPSAAHAPVRELLLALGATLGAAVIVGAVLLGVRHERAQSPDGGPAGLTDESHRLISAGARSPESSLPPGTASAVRPGAATSAPTLATAHPAIAAMQRGCDQGSAVSCRRLGTLYQRGRGVAANRARAFELYDRACRAGDARGCALRDAADHTLSDVDRDDRDDAEYFSTLGL